MTITGYTVSELAKKTGKTRHAVESLLSRHKVKPIVGEVLYPPEVIGLIKEARQGRPRKPAAPEKPTSKGKKAK
jgi:hypothetical protein